MKEFQLIDNENGEVYEICQKTRKTENPKKCDGCEELIKKIDYYQMADSGECYCLRCCQRS